jgi:hypothetical protein
MRASISLFVSVAFFCVSGAIVQAQPGSVQSSITTTDTVPTNTSVTFEWRADGQ